jgi:hypothetical protein
MLAEDDRRIIEHEYGLAAAIVMRLTPEGQGRVRLRYTNMHDGHAVNTYFWLVDPMVLGPRENVPEPTFENGLAVTRVGRIPPRDQGALLINVPDDAVAQFAVVARWTDGSGTRKEAYEAVTLRT